jgi:cell division protein FtsI (penicillin-binding protein 3)
MPLSTDRSLIEKRIHLLVALSLLLFLIFSIRLVDVQALRSSNLMVKASNELQRTSLIPAPRGTITDINGVDLARSVLSYRIVVDQLLIYDPKEVAKLTAPILNMDRKFLEERLTGERRYVVIANRVRPVIWRDLEKFISNYNESISSERNGLTKRITGFWAERLYDREYPAGELTASLLGFTNAAGMGAAGIEYSLNSLLTGQDGAYTYANAGGAIIPGTQEILTESIPGQSIKLTIDRDVQWVAQQAISKVVKKSRAISGTVIVQNPKTGEILAHATFPTFDPENRQGVDPLRYRNLSVEEVYEPGSTGKVITYAAAIEEQKISPESILTIPYKLKRYGKVFKDHEFHKTQKLTATGALANSTNTGAIKIGEMLGKDKLHEYLKKFGLGSVTGSHLPGESAGKLAPVKDWSGTSLPTFSFGHGYSLTTIQATSIFATLANDGVRVAPTVVAGTTSASGVFTPRKSEAPVRVISSETAEKMRLMMESVVGPDGTAAGAAIEGYRVAGKTGTAVRYDSVCGCYKGYTASFIGFAPAEDPAFVMSVTIQGPKGVYYGGYLGAPVFKEVMSYVLESRNIPPSKEATTTYAINYREYKEKISQAEEEKKKKRESSARG